MKPSDQFEKEKNTFIQACTAEINRLQTNIDKEEEKETPDEDILNELSDLKDEIEEALNEIANISTE